MFLPGFQPSFLTLCNVRKQGNQQGGLFPFLNLINTLYIIHDLSTPHSFPANSIEYPQTMSSTREAQVKEYGWTAVPCDLKQKASALKKPNKASLPQLVKDIPLPNTAIAQSVLEYAEAELPKPTFNHSMRVFYYGTHPKLAP